MAAEHQKQADVILDCSALENIVNQPLQTETYKRISPPKPPTAAVCKGMTCAGLVFAAFFLAGGATMIAMHSVHERNSSTLSEVYSIPTNAIGACLVAFAGLVVLFAIFNYWRHRTI